MSASENWNPWRDALVLFGRTLRGLREDAGLTQQVLGERIHASNRTLSDLELGKGERVPAEALVVGYVDRCLDSWEAAKVKRDERRADLLRSYHLLHELREQLRSSRENVPARVGAPKPGQAADNFDELFLRQAVLPDAALPSMLLRPEYGVVPFFGRQAEVADLLSWTAGTGAAARLVTGPAGQGKTRLALRLCELVQAEGWAAGVVSEDGDPELIERLASTSAPLLLVVDYAEARVPALLSLARTLLTRPAESPARLLLLARSAGGWLGELHRDADDEVAGLFLQTVEQRLTPLARSVADRHAEFARALGAIAFQLRRGTEDIDPPPGIDTVRYERALDIHAAALAALLDLETPEDRSDPRRDPVLRVLHHEQRYWRRTADSAGLPDPDQRRVRCVVALATLFGAGSEKDAVDLLRTSPSFENVNTALVRRFVRWAKELYPGPQVLDPLRPDRLGEDHVALTLAEEPEIATAPPAVVDDARLRQAITVLGRAAPRHPEAASALADIAAGNRHRFFDLAIGVATALEDPRPLAAVLERTVGTSGEQLGILDLALEKLPATTLALVDLAVMVNAQALQVHLRLPDRDPAVTAHLLVRLTSRLRQAGRYAEALNAVDNAAGIYRQLCERDQETYLPNLASTLTMRSVCLGQLGRNEEAIASGADAVDRYRELASADPQSYATELANALNALGNRYKAVGLRKEALETSEKATDLYLGLWQGGATYVLPDLARSMNNLAVHLNAVGELGRALTAVTEAVELRRQLSDRNPDAYLPDLASSLNNLANILDDLDRPTDATEVMREAVDTYRRLAEHRPDVHLPDLAMTLNNYSINLSAIGETGEALTASAESAEIYQSLANDQPGVFQADLGMALNTLSVRLARAGDLEKALDTVRESVRVRRGLLPTEDFEVLNGLVASLNNLGIRLRALDRHDEALDVAREAVQRCRELAEREVAYGGRLADALNGLALAELRVGNITRAVAAGRESVSILQPLHSSQPAGLRRRLLAALLNYADALRHADPDETRVVLTEIANLWDQASDSDLLDRLQEISSAVDAAGP